MITFKEYFVEIFSWSVFPKLILQNINNYLNIGIVPGQNTLILKSVRKNISKYLLGPNNSIGVRIPDHNIPMKITKLLGRVITSTSVNKTNMKPINDPKKINEQFSNEVDLMIDVGKINNSNPSNIFNLTSKKIIQIR